MAEKAGPRPPRSLMVEILIVVLIGVLLTSILYPKKLWKQQSEEEILCRQRMENILYAAQFYHQKLGRHTGDIATILELVERESLTVQPAGFKIDRLTREDSGVDSFQLEYFDPFQHYSHYERAVEIIYPAGQKAVSGPDSVVLTVVPKVQYAFLPVTYYVFASDEPITAVIDNRGDQGMFALVGAPGRLHGSQILGQPTQVRAAEYLFNIDTKDIDRCPISNTQFKTEVNVKLIVEALVQMTLEKSPPPQTVSGSRLFASNVVYRLLKEADAAAKRVLLEEKKLEMIEDSLLHIVYNDYIDSSAAALRQEGLSQLAQAIYDSTLEERPLPDREQKRRWEKIRDGVYDRMNLLKTDSTFGFQRDELVNQYKRIIVDREFRAGIERIRAQGRYTIVEGGTINTTADSIAFYSQPELIKTRLIHERTDSVTIAHLNSSEMTGLLNTFSYTESYKVVKADTIGINIICPIEGEYIKPNRSLLEWVFSIGGAGNHGSIRNGDLSWSEKR
ncbi:MAG: hypothetical protein FJY65_11160 [Calditrichaeota bacterium]|nr:hypothetical protein [Calditrichota bacterium]